MRAGIKKCPDGRLTVEHRTGKRKNYRVDDTHVSPAPFNKAHTDWLKDGFATKRDTMKQKCYDAETARRPHAKQRTFESHADLARYFRGVMESDWFQRRFPCFRKLVLVYNPHLACANAGPIDSLWFGKRKGDVLVGKITYGKWPMSGEGGGAIIMLHELAHAVLPCSHQHSRLWARTFVEFVSHFVSKEEGRLLRAEMAKRNVKMNAFKKISPVQRAAFRERMLKVLDKRIAAGYSEPVPSTPLMESATCGSFASV